MNDVIQRARAYELAVKRDIDQASIVCDIASPDLTVFFCEQNEFAFIRLCRASDRPAVARAGGVERIGIAAWKPPGTSKASGLQ
jgi:hypothetical protein